MKPLRPALWATLTGAAGTLTPGCAMVEEEPVAVARAFAEAVARREPRELVPLVDARAVSQLERAAERATNQVGGRRNLPSWQMLQIVDVEPGFEVGRARFVADAADHGRVVFQAQDDRSYEVEVVREEAGWKVRLPVPTGAAPW